MREAVGKVEEKRLILVGPDKFDALVGVAPGDRMLVGRTLNDLRVLYDRHIVLLDWSNVVGIFPRSLPVIGKAPAGVHVIGVGNAPVRIKAVGNRKELGKMPQVPLADRRGGVAHTLEALGNRHLALLQPSLGIREKHSPAGRHHPVSNREPAGKKRRPTGSTDARPDVEIGPALPLSRHPVKMGCANHRIAETAEVAIAKVITEDDDKVRLVRRIQGAGQAAERKEDTDSDSTHVFSLSFSVPENP